MTDKPLHQEDSQEAKEDRLSLSLIMESFFSLAGSISNDINNLLMSIQGNTSLMLMETDSRDPRYGKLKKIERSVQNCAELTKRFLSYTGGDRYDPKPADPNDLLRKSREVFGRANSKVRTHENLQKDIWAVEVDQVQIEQALLNIFIFAANSMAGGGDLYLQTENVTLVENDAEKHGLETGGYVKISVTDTGTGIDKVTQKKIFDRFYITKDSYLNPELGLASAYTIIKNHKGGITVYSEPNQGTTFTVYLPISKDEFVQEEAFAETLSKGSETILLVDDEDVILDVGAQMLEKLGYKILTAGNGKEALNVYADKKQEVDMVILDVIMPEMGGREAFENLRQIDSGVKVLLSSGYGINRQITEILQSGCNGFIQKPFNMKQLSRKVREILDEP